MRFSPVGLVAEADCTLNANRRKLCEWEKIRTFPTIKYGHPNDLEEYNGGVSYEDLSEFAKENLVPLCSPSNLDLCDEEAKKQIETYMAISSEELGSLIATEKKKLIDAETAFQRKIDALQAKYAEFEQEKDELVAEIRFGGLGMMESVKTAKEKAAAKEAANNEAKDEL